MTSRRLFPLATAGIIVLLFATTPIAQSVVQSASPGGTTKYTTDVFYGYPWSYTLLPDNLGPASSSPVFDPANGDFYYISSLLGASALVNVFDPSTDRVVASIPVGYEVLSNLLFDQANGNIYLGAISQTFAGAVEVVNTTTNKVSTSIPFQLPSTMVLDTSNGLIYAEGYSLTGNLGVINATTNKIVGIIPFKGALFGGIFNPSNGEAYFVQFPSYYVEVLNCSSQTMVANLTAKANFLSNGVYDPATQDVYFAGEAQNSSTIAINSTNFVMTSDAGTGPSAIGLVLDPDTGYLYFLNLFAGQSPVIPVVNPVTLTNEQNVSANFTPYVSLGSGAYDTANHLLYLMAISGNFYILNGTEAKFVGILPTEATPQAVAYDPVDRMTYVSSVLEGENESLVSIMQGQNIIQQVYIGREGSGGTSSMAVSTRTGLVYVSTADNGTVFAMNGTSGAIVGRVEFGRAPIALAYDSNDNLLYGLYNGSLAEEDDLTAVNLSTGANVTMSIAGSATAMSYDPDDGLVLITEYSSGTVAKVQANTTAVVGSVQTFANGLVLYPQTIYYDPQTGIAFVGGSIYPGSLSNSSSSVISLNPKTDKTVTDVSWFPISAVYYDSNNSCLYVASLFYGTEAFQGPGFQQSASVSAGNGPVGIALNSENGYLYFADGQEAGTVTLLEPSAPPTTTTTTSTSISVSSSTSTSTSVSTSTSTSSSSSSSSTTSTLPTTSSTSTTSTSSSSVSSTTSMPPSTSSTTSASSSSVAQNGGTSQTVELVAIGAVAAVAATAALLVSRRKKGTVGQT